MKKKKVIFVAGVGGHLTELLQLDSLFKEYDYTLITEKTEVTKDLKNKYNVKYFFYNNKKNYIKDKRRLKINYRFTFVTMLPNKPTETHST